MKNRRQRAFTLMHALLYTTLSGVILTVAGYAITQSLRIQQRISIWANDDTITQGLLQQMRRDASAANEAQVVQEDSPVLVFQEKAGQVRYRTNGNVIERAAQAEGRPTDKRTWRLGRSSVQWAVEPTRAGEAVVWADVQIRDPIHRGKPATQRYTVGVRVGGLASPEDVR